MPSFATNGRSVRELFSENPRGGGGLDHTHPPVPARIKVLLETLDCDVIEDRPFLLPCWYIYGRNGRHQYDLRNLKCALAI